MRILLPSAILLALAVQPATNDIDIDFHGGKFRESVLRYTWPVGKEYVTRETEGLRITIPVGQDIDDKPVPQVGFVSQLVVHGDFEITVAYEILSAGTPAKGYGVGVNLQIYTDNDSKDSATIANRTHPTEGQIYATNRAFKKDGVQYDKVNRFPADVKSGQLRLTRKGANLTYLVSKPDSDSFESLREVKFVNEPLNRVRVTGDVGNSLSPLDVRIHSFHIHSLELTASLPPVTNHGYLIPGLVGVGVLCVVAVGAFFAWRYLRNSSDAPEAD
jgi:Protein of unknown function (DUF1583)